MRRLIPALLLLASCGATTTLTTLAKESEPRKPSPSAPSATSQLCSKIDDITSKLYLTYVVHNEEDDANCVASSAPEPDYNGNKTLYLVYSKTILDLAKLLNEFGVKLSFQPDWTFVEGVKKFQPNFFGQLLAVGNVEVLPHAHATCVSYPELYRRLEILGAKPQKIVGGALWEDFLSNNENKSPKGWPHWGAPAASLNHKSDRVFPPVVYRMKSPHLIQKSGDENVHDASSPVIVTPGFLISPGQPIELGVLSSNKPLKRLLSPVYIFDSPKFVVDAKSATKYLNRVRQMIQSKVLPHQQKGSIEFIQTSGLIELFKKYESCLDLKDGASVLR